MKKRQKKPYETPTTVVVLFEASVSLLADSDFIPNSSIDPWDDSSGGSGDVNF